MVMKSQVGDVSVLQNDFHYLPTFCLSKLLTGLDIYQEENKLVGGLAVYSGNCPEVLHNSMLCYSLSPLAC